MFMLCIHSTAAPASLVAATLPSLTRPLLGSDPVTIMSAVFLTGAAMLL